MHFARAAAREEGVRSHLRISPSFFFSASLICSMCWSVIFWTSATACFSSSSLTSWSFSSFFRWSLASRRTLRMATRPSSACLWACLTRVLRRSSVSDGMGMRMSFPSFCGFRSRSEPRMAFSMGWSSLGSQGWMVMRVGSGVARLPTWLRGVGVP